VYYDVSVALSLNDYSLCYIQSYTAPPLDLLHNNEFIALKCRGDTQLAIVKVWGSYSSTPHSSERVAVEVLSTMLPNTRYPPRSIVCYVRVS
jgi:hypothetical protein